MMAAIIYSPPIRPFAAPPLCAAAAQEELAELELLYLQERLSDMEARALLAFARDKQYPAVQLALAARLGGSTANGLPLPLFESSYPIVDIATRGIDRALLLALIRQESRFKARAKSHAGARGLMQIMPGTAAFVTDDWSLYRRRGRDQLLDAELNSGNRPKIPDHVDGRIISMAHWCICWPLIMAGRAMRAGGAN